LFPVGLCNELLFLTSSILTSEVNQNQHDDKSNTEDDGPGEDVLLEVLHCPEEEPDKDSQHSKDDSKNIEHVKEDFLAVERVVVLGDWLPYGVGLT
jgi:hypothetical protein